MAKLCHDAFPLAVAWHGHRTDVAASAQRLPLGTIAAVTLLHLVSLLVRAEAWRLALGAVNGRRVPRPALHAASAGAFLAGAAESHSALPVRMALLRRLAPTEAPRVSEMALADAPILLLELGATLVLVAAAAGGLPGVPRAGVAGALTLGLAVSATTLLAVLLYTALAAAGWTLARRRRAPGPTTTLRRTDARP